MSEDHFWARVVWGEGCWEWNGSRMANGYGRFYRPGHSRLAHRVAWELRYGPIPDGLCVLHRCDNPPCVRPSHLFLGTRTDNDRDRDRKGRVARGDTHGRRKLSGSQVWAIRARRSAGEPLRSLAAEFGVTEGAISMIASGRRWQAIHGRDEETP